jgi:hypothetical protein
MAFFKNTPDDPKAFAPKSEADSLPEETNAAPVNSFAHSVRSRALFKRPTGESLPAQQIPLPTVPHERALAQGVLQAGGTAFQAGRVVEDSLNLAPNGQFLNALDGDLTAGIERYFPSPLFRLRISQKRLITQIATLREELEQYTRVPGKTPEMLLRQKSLQRRLWVLEYRERRVTQELSSLLLWGDFLSGFFAQLLHIRRLLPELLRLLLREWQRLTRGQAYISAAQANEDLNVLYRVLATRITDSTVSAAELGRLMNLYDRLYAQASRDMQAMAATKEKRRFFGR